METLYEKQSDFQKIMLMGDRQGRITLLLDGFFQFDSAHENSYHEFIAGLPLAFCDGARNVLIMGGGDGLAVREVLRQPIDRVTLCELDPAVIELARRAPISKLNRGSLTDPRTRVVIGDAKAFLKRKELPEGFDVIIADFPAATNEELKKLYSAEFYDDVFKNLAPAGVFVSQISEGLDFCRTLRAYLETMLGHSFTLISLPAVHTMEMFVYGSRVPFEIRREPAGEILPSAAWHVADTLARKRPVVVCSSKRMRPLMGRTAI